ncbi:MAG: hypothetical protein M3024_06790 [Candidatus Dormibacteraeota bacterium]|nr:hypothetical protein [Candidatus Dormibacteraeota bacterium]
MSRRTLLALAAIGLAALTAVWFAVRAPSGPGAAPLPQVVLTATASGSGTWTRYLVNVKNVADGTFSGDVLLVDLEPNPGGVGPALPDLVAQRGARVAPQVAGQSVYRVHVEVASRHRQTVAILAPEHFGIVEAVQSGLLLAGAPVTLQPNLPVAVVSDVETAAAQIAGLHFDRYQPPVAAFSAASSLPESAVLLAGYSIVVIDEFDTARLSALQVQALRDFVRFGGTLVLAGGSDWRRTLSPLPDDLLPLRPTDTVTASLLPVAGLAGVGAADLVAPLATGPVGSAARVLVQGPAASPLMTAAAHGYGQVVELAYDPAEAPVAGSPYSGLGWTQGIARGIQGVVTNGPSADWLLGPDLAVTGLLPAADEPPVPWPPLSISVLLLYVLAVGPGAYWWARHRGRPALFWALVPIFALAGTGVFYAAGQLLQGSLQVRQLQVMKVGPDRSATVLEYDRVLFLRRGNHLISLAPGSVAAPLTLATYRVTGSTCERCVSQLQGLPSGAESVLPGATPVVEESGVVYGSVRVVASASIGNAQPGVTAHLQVRGGRIQGTIENPGPTPVADLAVFAFDGQSILSAQLVRELGPGRTAKVDSPLQPGIQGGDALVSAVGTEAVAGGQPVLVGLTPPRPSAVRVDGVAPPGLAAAVFQQSVTLQAGDATARGFLRQALASTVGDVSSGFTDVYDLEVPASVAIPMLWVDPSRVGRGQVEVFDWSLGRFAAPQTVRGAPDGATAVALPLAPSQVGGGLVRIRVHDPRVQWSSAFWVGGP